MFAEVAFVDAHRKLEGERDEEERKEIEKRLQIATRGDTSGPITQVRGESSLEENEHDGAEQKEIPKLKPVATFEVGIGEGLLVGRDGSEPGGSGGCHVE